MASSERFVAAEPPEAPPPVDGDTASSVGVTFAAGTAAPSNNKRATAKEQVASAWKERRSAKGTLPNSKSLIKAQAAAERQSTTAAQSNTGIVTTDTSNGGGVLVKQQGWMPLCVLVQKTWDEWRKQQYLKQGPVVPPPKPKQQKNYSSKLQQAAAAASSNNKGADSATGTSSTTATANNNITTNIPTKSNTHKRMGSTGFPSVLSILQANALAQHVQEWEESHDDDDVIPEDDDTKRDGPATSRSASPTTAAQQQQQHTQDAVAAQAAAAALQVLPAGYDWNRAVQEMAKSRSRAFLLLDLTALLQRLVTWKQKLSRMGLLNTSNNNNICPKFVFWHSVQSNADSKLLQVLLKSGIVALATTTRTDLARAVSVVSSSTSANSNRDSIILDSTLQGGGKPDAYLRELLWTAKVATFCVDGPNEVTRIMHSLQRIAKRRQASRGGLYTIKFIVKLKEKDFKNDDKWRNVVETTLHAIQQWNNDNKHDDDSNNEGKTTQFRCRLDGLSFCIAAPPTSNEEEHKDADAELEAARAKQIAVESLVDWIDEHQQQHGQGLRIDLTGWKSNSSNTKDADPNAPKKRVSRTKERKKALIPDDQPPVEWLEWSRHLLNKTSKSTTTTTAESPSVIVVRQVTMEASAAMVAPVGALCTRLIGVKTTETTNAETNETVVKRHYYIDDGCYGSLYNGGAETNYQPLPLLPQQENNNNTTNNNSNKTKNNKVATTTNNAASNGTTAAGAATDSTTANNNDNNNNNTEIPVYLSTVWGPTCDGLDKVCQDIPLPLMKRDDWLVFPNLGACASEGLGTAFNGFSPPDTAYCVLGYFK